MLAMLETVLDWLIKLRTPLADLLDLLLDLVQMALDGGAVFWL